MVNVTILILVDGFLQLKLRSRKNVCKQLSQSLFQQMVFCNQVIWFQQVSTQTVTILILVDGFLQYNIPIKLEYKERSHNPYFSRWFSAMIIMMIILTTITRSQSLFQQMVFCNKDIQDLQTPKKSHNPYFSRWFSAILIQKFYIIR